MKDGNTNFTTSNQVNNISSHHYSHSPDLRNKNIEIPINNAALEFGSRRNRPSNINEAIENSNKNSVLSTPVTNKDNLVDSRRRKNFNI